MTSRSVRSAQQDQVLTLWIVTIKVTLRVTVTVSPGVESLLRFITKSYVKWSVSPLTEGGRWMGRAGRWSPRCGGGPDLRRERNGRRIACGAAHTGTPSLGAVSLSNSLKVALLFCPKLPDFRKRTVFGKFPAFASSSFWYGQRVD